MEQLELLLSTMIIYESNFRVLHWNAAGRGFNESHNVFTKKYYEELADSIDKVAEIGCMLNKFPMNYVDVLDFYNEVGLEPLIVDAKRLYNREEIIKISDIMLEDVCSKLIKAIQSEVVQAEANIGIKADLESMLSKYMLEAKFINKRRMMNV